LKVLIIGGKGMAGHMIKEYLIQKSTDEIWYTQRGEPTDERALYLDVMNEVETRFILHRLKPDVVINAVGLLNHQADESVKEAIYINSLFPHKLAEYGKELGFRLIHISTDCVFSGEQGEYTENDLKDGLTVYAKTKSLGEIIDERNLTIRTSIIGPELKKNGIGLFHWFMQQKDEISGYRQVFWNGVTTLELAKVIKWVLHQPINGLVHLSSPEKISKYQLLLLIQYIFNKKDVHIKPEDKTTSDKSLMNTRDDFSYQINTYKVMIEELYHWIQKQANKRGCPKSPFN
jgi:dTDP-4-dehydrorhamnose reductase